MAVTNKPEHGVVLSASSRRGTQREYESVTILRPESSKAEIRELIRRVTQVVEGRAGRLLKIDNWGTRILSYRIARCRKGIYLYWRYLGGSDMVAEVERHMRLSLHVIRYATVRIEDDIDPDARPTEIDDALIDMVSDPGVDPDELARQRRESSTVEG